MARYLVTPQLTTTGFVWVNEFDTKFNKDGLFHFEAVGMESDPQVASMIETLDLEATEAHAIQKEKMEAAAKDPKQKKAARELAKYVPYEREEDDNGNPTGYVKFTFKQNRLIRQKDGKSKEINIELRDSENNIISDRLTSGATVRVRYSVRHIYIAASNEVGPRLDFAAIQVIELGQQGSSGGFDKVEGGYVGSSGQTSRSSERNEDEAQGDY